MAPRQKRGARKQIPAGSYSRHAKRMRSETPVPNLIPTVTELRVMEIQEEGLIIQAEKGFELSAPGELCQKFIEDTAKIKGWGFFAQHPTDRVPVALVREFLAAYSLGGEAQTSVMVRGVRVRIDIDTIREVYGLEGMEQTYCYYHLLTKDKQKPEVRDKVAERVFNRNGEVWPVGKVLTKDTCPEAQIWSLFVRSRILPSRHGHTMPLKNAIIVYCILCDLPFRVDTLVHEAFCANAKDPSPAFFFPHLVKLLCDKAGVPTADNDLEKVPPSPIIGESCLKKIVGNPPRSKKHREGPSGTTPSQATTSQTPQKRGMAAEGIAAMEEEIGNLQSRLATTELQNEYLLQFNTTLLGYLKNKHKFDKEVFEDLDTDGSVPFPLFPGNLTIEGYPRRNPMPPPTQTAQTPDNEEDSEEDSTSRTVDV